jgi:tetratricopeptide (TPR) repeat protein
MRIAFASLGHAQRYLNTCKHLLEFEPHTAEFDSFPTQRVRNELCRGFGYNSFDELKRVLVSQPKHRTVVSPKEGVEAALVEGLSRALDVMDECGFAHSLPREWNARHLARKVIEEVEDGVQHIHNQKADEIEEEAWEAIRGISRPPDFALGKQLFQQAIATNPDQADAYNGLACIEMRLKNYGEGQKFSALALEKARKSLAGEDPTSYSWWGALNTRSYMRARHNLGLCMWRQGDLVGAIKEFETLVKLNPNDNQGVRFLIGSLYHQGGKLGKAIAAYKRSAANAEYSGDSHNAYNYALALFEAKKHAESVLRFRCAFFSNLHIAEILLSKPVKTLPICYGNNLAEPAYAYDYEDEYASLWADKATAIEFLKAVYTHPTVKGEVKHFIELGKRLNTPRDQQIDYARRGFIVDEQMRLRNYATLRDSNPAIAGDVIGALSLAN